MGGFGLLVAFCLLGFAYTIDLDIPSDGNRVNLIPVTDNSRSETQWNLKACKGCKMVLVCAFKLPTCNQATVKIDTGERFFQFCPEDDMVFSNTSVKNVMSVTIEQVGKPLGAYCQVRATKSFIDLPEQQIDSSEHGVSEGKKKTSCRCGWTNKSPQRIVGGKETGINEYPFIVLLMETKSRSSFCGGAIITERHVLTAAHCTEPKKDIALSVIVGEHDLRTWKETKATKIIDAEKVIDHPDYEPGVEVNDISIMYLKESVPLSDLVGRVCMPTAQRSLVNEYIKVMGWGLTKDEEEGGKSSAVLRKVNLKVIDPEVCKVIYSIDPTKATQICTFNNAKDSCQGDSGGPLVSLNTETNRFVQVALVSFGRKCASTDPGVNTDVAHYMPWIKAQIKATKNVEMCF